MIMMFDVVAVGGGVVCFCVFLVFCEVFFMMFYVGAGVKEPNGSYYYERLSFILFTLFV